jgi:hypothetical protein
MEGALSSLLKSNREPTKSTTFSLSSSHPSTSRPTDVTHAWLLVQCVYLFYFKNRNSIKIFLSIKISRHISF